MAPTDPTDRKTCMSWAQLTVLGDRPTDMAMTRQDRDPTTIFFRTYKKIMTKLIPDKQKDMTSVNPVLYIEEAEEEEEEDLFIYWRFMAS